MSIRVPVHRHRTPGLRRIIGASFVVFLLLAQAASAADRCLMELLSGHHESPAAVVGDHHEGAPSAHCVADPSQDAQAPGTEPRRVIPDLDAVVTRVVRWDVAPRADVRAAQRVPPYTGPPRTLQYHSLRL